MAEIDALRRDFGNVRFSGLIHIVAAPLHPKILNGLLFALYDFGNNSQNLPELVNAHALQFLIDAGNDRAPQFFVPLCSRWCKFSRLHIASCLWRGVVEKRVGRFVCDPFRLSAAHAQNFLLKK